MPESIDSDDDDLDLAAVDVDREGLEVQQVRARAYAKLFGEAPPDPPTACIGRFELRREVGRGGMGVVYAAFDPQLQRAVALKVVRAAGVERGARGQRRLLREARAAARLSHPNVVTIYEVGEEAGAVHIAMELLDAVTLRQHEQRLRGDARAIARAYLAAGRGLAAAHAAGLVHRDFKPDNVLVARDGRVCVTDFGLAIARGDADDRDESGELPQLRADDLTTHGVLGTPPYMAPEQLRGQGATALADQFGFCVALWEGLAGRRPFAGDDVPQLCAAIEAARFAPVAEGAQFPAALRAICRRGLAADPARRFASMDALLDRLAMAITPARSRLLPVFAVAGLVGGTALWWRSEQQACSGGGDRIATVWHADRRAALGRAFVDTGLPFAADVARELDRQLEQYAQAWQDGYREVCERTRVRDEASETALDHGMACLDDRLARLDATLGVLERVEPELVESALAVSSSLPALAPCRAADAPAGAIALPEDPRARAAVQAQLSAIEQGAALRRGGRPQQSDAALAEAIHAAAQLGYPSLLALAQLEAGETALALADEARAAALLEQAITAGDPATIAQASVADAAVTLQQGDARGAVAVIRAARIAVGAAGNAPHLQARLWQLDSRAAYARGDFARALEDGRRALAVVLDLHGERSLEAAAAIHVIAAALHGQGAWREAVDENERARVIREGLLGPHHPLVAESWTNLGGSWLALAELERARQCYAEALAIDLAAYGEEHPAVAELLLNRGTIAAQQGQREAAQADFDRALAILQQRLGPDHVRVAPALLDLAGLALERGALDEAATQAQRALDLLTAHRGDAHPSLAIPLGYLAAIAGARGDHVRAVELSRRALAIREAALGAQHPMVERSRAQLAEAEAAAGDGESSPKAPEIQVVGDAADGGRE